MATSDRHALLKALLGKIDEAHADPDAKLPGERELASSFGASRSSVREALGVLEALRVIERRPQSGIYLRADTADASVETLVLQEALDVRRSVSDYEQVQEARVIHEVEAIRLASKRRTSADLDTMRTIIETSRSNLRLGKNLATDDEAFHLAVIAAAKNPILLRIAKSLYLITRSVRQAYFEAPGSGQNSIREHERIVESLAARNTTRSVLLMRKHYAGSSARWKKTHRQA